MPENPALTLYHAWDNLFRLGLSRRQARHLDEQLPTYTHEAMDKRPYQFDRWGASAHIINHRTGFQPVAKHAATGKYIYTMGYLDGRKVTSPLFQIDPKGHFRLGSTFTGYCTRGAFERIQEHTFLGANRGRRYNDWLWWFRGFDSDQMWCNEREWRRHTYYWEHRSVPITTWFLLMQVGGQWRVDIAGGNEDYVNSRDRLRRQYQEAEHYYAKWRRKHFRQKGVTDVERPLDASEIETVDYIAQHLRVYDPPKARMPG